MRFVLALKGLPHDLVYVDPERPPKDLVAAVPGAILPTLMEREVVLYEPRIIAEYLDERFPHPPLLPNDPLGRARCRLTYYRIEQEWLAPLDQIRNGSAAAGTRARAELRDALIESDPVFNAAKFFLSSDMGLADWTFEIEKSTGQQISDRLMQIYDNYPTALANVKATLVRVDKQYDDAFKYLKRVV